MSLPRAIHPYYFHADLIWWDGPFKSYAEGKVKCETNSNQKVQIEAIPVPNVSSVPYIPKVRLVNLLLLMFNDKNIRTLCQPEKNDYKIGLFITGDS
jgi:hypothetical protein